MQIDVNGEARQVPEVWQNDSLLHVLHEFFGLVGAKYGCGAGLCGACTVLVDDEPIRSCVTPVSAVREGKVQTIEGLMENDRLHAVQQAWIDSSIPQCGYCQTGQIMATIALLRKVRQPTEADLDTALEGHLCRCGTQPRIRSAVKKLSGMST
jgi:aerobic-type carbon monoxide dehydrogenase small subunit (CoxS/CutS family)